MECTMNRSHMGVLDIRFSCTGKGVIFRPKAASEITTTSVIAAIQVREAMKVISGIADTCIHGIMYYDGISCSMEIFEISIDSDCPNHNKE